MCNQSPLLCPLSTNKKEAIGCKIGTRGVASAPTNLSKGKTFVHFLLDMGKVMKVILFDVKVNMDLLKLC
jgi:hypothetical protein